MIENKRPTFQSPYEEYKHFIGHEFEIIKKTDAQFRNHPDFTDTYLIKFPNGQTITALPEEVLTGIGWEPNTHSNES